MVYVDRIRGRPIAAKIQSLELMHQYLDGTGITLFETVPGLTRLLDTHDVLSAIGPRPTMVVSGTKDKYSRDADQVVAKIANDFITELRVDREHALDQERFDAIIEWIVGRVSDQ